MKTVYYWLLVKRRIGIWSQRKESNKNIDFSGSEKESERNNNKIKIQLIQRVFSKVQNFLH